MNKFKSDVEMMVAHNADVALKSRLYVSGWLLSGYLRLARLAPENYYVHLHYVDERPVGVILISNIYSNEPHVQIFVRKSMRRKGIGTILYSHAKGRFKVEKFKRDMGIVGSRTYWDKMESINDLR